MNKLLHSLKRNLIQQPFQLPLLAMKSYYLEIGYNVTRQITQEATLGHAYSLAIVPRVREASS